MSQRKWKGCVDTYPGLAATPLKRGRAARDHNILQIMGMVGLQASRASVPSLEGWPQAGVCIMLADASANGKVMC